MKRFFPVLSAVCLAAFAGGCGEFEFKSQLKRQGVAAGEAASQEGPPPAANSVAANPTGENASGENATGGNSTGGTSGNGHSNGEANLGGFIETADDRQPASPVEIAPNQQRENAAAVPALRYRWEPDRKYAYSFHIEIDDGETLETLKGTPVYTVKQADQDGATLAFSGRLTPHRRVKSGFPDPRTHLRLNFFSPFGGVSGSGMHREHELTVDPWGDVKNIRGDSQLPFMLGHLSLLVIQPLSEQPQREWEVVEPVTIEITETSRFPTGPRFGPRGPRGPFGGGPATTRIDAEEATRFTVTAVDHERALVQKDYRLSTSHTVGGKPRYAIVGKGETTFDLQRGVPRKMDFRLTVTVNSERGSAVTPISVSYRLLSDEELAQMEQEAADRIPKPLEADELAAAVEELQTGDSEAVLKALQRFEKTEPMGDRAAAASALETVLAQTTDQQIRKAAAQTLAAWGTVENVPALLNALDTDATHVRWAVMGALGKLQDERAIEPLAARLTVGIDRNNAASALKEFGPAAEQAVLAHIEHPEWSVRLKVYHLLEHVGTEASVPALEQAVLTETRSNTVWAKKALEKAKQRGSKP